MKKNQGGSMMLAGVIGWLFLMGTGVAEATVLLSYDFETVAPTNLFVCQQGGGTVSNATMTALGAGNAVSTAIPYGQISGMGEASGVVAQISSTSGDAYFQALEKASSGSAVIAALNALTPGVYYLRISYDESKVGMSPAGDNNFKVGVTLYGSDGGGDQGARGASGSPGSFAGIRVWYGGVSAKDPVQDNAFVKCLWEHEVNNLTSGNSTPWRIKIIPASGTPDDLNVFKQGSFTQLEIVLQQNISSGATYLDNIKIEYFVLDRNAPIYLDDITRTGVIPVASPYSSAYVDYPATTVVGDGMIELIRSVNSTNIAYTRAGDVTIDVNPYKDTAGQTCAGSFGCGIHGYNFLGTSGLNRAHPLWIAGDGQTPPTNNVALWRLRDQGLASHGFGAFANQLITFDMQKVRSYLLNGSTFPIRIEGRFGMLGETIYSDNVRGGIWVDGVRRFISASKNRTSSSDPFSMILKSTDRYLTLVFLNDGSWWEDNAVFKDVTMTLLPSGTILCIK